MNLIGLCSFRSEMSTLMPLTLLTLRHPLTLPFDIHALISELLQICLYFSIFSPPDDYNYCICVYVYYHLY